MYTNVDILFLSIWIFTVTKIIIAVILSKWNSVVINTIIVFKAWIRKGWCIWDISAVNCLLSARAERSWCVAKTYYGSEHPQERPPPPHDSPLCLMGPATLGSACQNDLAQGFPDLPHAASGTIVYSGCTRVNGGATPSRHWTPGALYFILPIQHCLFLFFIISSWWRQNYHY